ncbi:MAG TPA: porin family protein, partial [Beijerinckiaceae bacterium]|nr:porin family protein [Beijerinckiaceae bacterium]
YAFTNNLTAKVEGLYVNLGNGDNNNVGAVYSLPTNTLFLGNGRNGDDSFGVVRAGINYKFGS